ncbi:MAG: oligosaccharide flippase family protein [Terriglobia bacterium]
MRQRWLHVDDSSSHLRSDGVSRGGWSPGNRSRATLSPTPGGSSSSRGPAGPSVRSRTAAIAGGWTARGKLLLASQLRRNIAIGTGMAVVSAFLSFLSYPIYLHFLGYRQYGVWLAVSTVLTFAQLGNFGINPAVSKFVAESHGSGDFTAVRRCLTTAWIALTLSSVSALCAVLLLREKIVDLFRLSGGEARLMLELLPFVAVLSAYVFIVESMNAAVVGLGRTDLESYYRAIGQSVTVTISAILLLRGYGVFSLLIGNFLAYMTMHLLSLAKVRREVGSKLLCLDGLTVSGLTKMLGFGSWVFGSSLVNMTLTPINRVLISRYAGIAALPLYEIAFGSSMKIRSLLESGIRAMMPEISRLGAGLAWHSRKRADTLNRAGMKLIFRLGLPLYATLLVFARPVLRIWLRSQFQEGFTPIFRIMLIGSFLSLLCVPAYYILMGLGEARRCFLSAVIQWVGTFLTMGMFVITAGTLTVVFVGMSLSVGIGLCTIYVLWTLHRFTASVRLNASLVNGAPVVAD